MRYPNQSGAEVKVGKQRDSHVYECAGCLDTYQLWDFNAIKNAANDHAKECRALPQR
ncbi:hypothetical protein [Streptomyces sp. NPDC006638]|uniref:hypothetical protein n=1 Tax=Streptomyces sp. NPDC006638 TaxID=3157183 RepID=UPI0033BB5B5C